MLEQKQRQILNLHEIPHKVMKPNFQFSSYYCYDRRSPNRNIYFFKNTDFLQTLTCKKKNYGSRIENQASYLGAECDADSKTVFVFILALIVFDFYPFEGSKNTFYRKGKCIYIYIYIYIFKEIKILPDYRVCPSFRIAARHASSGEKFIFYF